jgi:hypothetical protein
MLAGTPILVMTAQDDLRAGVRRDGEGFLWISTWREARPDSVAGTRLEGLRPAQIGELGCAAIGGALPEGARSGEVLGRDGAWHRAELAGGAWVAIVPWDHDDPRGLAPVRFHDGAGERISRADPAELSRARTLAEHEARLLARGGRLGGRCPVCGAEDWRAASAARGTGEHIFCGACGHSDGGVHGFWRPSVTRRPPQ